MQRSEPENPLQLLDAINEVRNVVSNDDCESYVRHVANNCGKRLNGERILITRWIILANDFD